METLMPGQYFDMFVRWIHIIAGILWIGHLYFFNFVNTQLQPAMDKEMKKVVNPLLMGKALWWFRWGAMITFLAGIVLYLRIYIMQRHLTDPTGGLSDRSWWIHLGMLFGIIMWFNVWFVIWPAQKVVQAAIKEGNAPDPALAARALKFSRVNTYLSGPMLFGMVGASHYYSVNALLVVSVLVGLLAIWLCYKHAPTVGKV